MLTHKNIVAIVASMRIALPSFETDSVLSYLPLAHVAERLMYLG
jgi:long-subunit acyl-CoA synthetase (AMP-forming)